MLTAWRDGIALEAIPQGVRLGGTEYQTGNDGQMTPGQDDERINHAELSAHLSRDVRRSQFDVDAGLLPLTDVEFPSQTPRQACVLAIAAARRYIIDHGGASRADLVEAMEPERKYPLGGNGVQARENGFEHAFRNKWWENIVAPGLRSLPDIEEPVHGSDQWLSQRLMTGGFDAKSTVEAILENGYL